MQRLQIVFDSQQDCDKWCSIDKDHWWWISSTVWWNGNRETATIVSVNRFRNQDGMSFEDFITSKENKQHIWKGAVKEPILVVWR